MLGKHAELPRLRKTIIVFSIALSWSVSSVPATAEIPTAKDLYAVLKTQEERIRSFQAEWKESRFSADPADFGEKRHDADVAMRWTRERVFTQSAKTQYKLMLGGLIADEYTDVRSYADSKDWSKNLTERPGSDRSRGTILPASAAALDPFQRPGDYQEASPIHQTYGYIQPAYINHFLDDNARIEITEEGYIRWTSAPTGGDHVAYYVLDPARDYTPVACGFVPAVPNNQKLSIRTELRDLKQVDGIWIPMEYETWLRPPRQGPSTRSIRKVKYIELNIPLSDQLLDLKFPVGAKIDDRIAGLTYTIGETPQEVHDASVIDSLFDLAESDSSLNPPIAELPPTEATLEKNLRSIPASALLPRHRLRPTWRTYLLFTAAAAGALVLTWSRRSFIRSRRKDKSP